MDKQVGELREEVATEWTARRASVQRRAPPRCGARPQSIAVSAGIRVFRRVHGGLRVGIPTVVWQKKCAEMSSALFDAYVRGGAATARRGAAERAAAAADERCAVEVAARQRVEVAAAAVQRVMDERVGALEKELKVEREAAVSAQKAEVMPSRDRASALCFSLLDIFLRRRPRPRVLRRPIAQSPS